MKMRMKVVALGLPIVAGLLTAMVPSEPASARKLTCHAKYQACESRCARRNDDSISCINRTCNPQFDNCDGGGRGRFSAPSTAKRPAATNSGKPDRPAPVTTIPKKRSAAR